MNGSLTLAEWGRLAWSVALAVLPLAALFLLSEEEIVLTVVYEDQVDTVSTEIVRAAELNDTGRGIAFVIPVEKVVGVAHFTRQHPDKE